jgi:cytochrome c oxidase assembly protein subunit 11
MSAAAVRRTRTALLAGLIAIGMGGLAYASVPLYRLFCDVTGFGGSTQRADTSALPDAARLEAVAGRTIKVRFDGNVRGLGWRFQPVTRVVEIPIGRQQMAFYRATSLSTAPTTGTATFNVSPAAAGRYFNKIQCFCFNEQTLKPGETVEMPVVWFVDPAILDDPDARGIDEITLSYSFFPVETPRLAPAIRATGKADIPTLS